MCIGARTRGGAYAARACAYARASAHVPSLSYHHVIARTLVLSCTHAREVALYVVHEPMLATGIRRYYAPAARTGASACAMVYRGCALACMLACLVMSGHATSCRGACAHVCVSLQVHTCIYAHARMHEGMHARRHAGMQACRHEGRSSDAGLRSWLHARLRLCM